MVDILTLKASFGKEDFPQGLQEAAFSIERTLLTKTFCSCNLHIMLAERLWVHDEAAVEHIVTLGLVFRDKDEKLPWTRDDENELFLQMYLGCMDHCVSNWDEAERAENIAALAKIQYLYEQIDNLGVSKYLRFRNPGQIEEVINKLGVDAEVGCTQKRDIRKIEDGLSFSVSCYEVDLRAWAVTQRMPTYPGLKEFLSDERVVVDLLP